MVHPSKIDKDNKYKLALGALVMSASHLEIKLLDILALALDTDIMATIIIAGHQQASSKIDSLIALVRLRAHGDEDNQSLAESGPVKCLLRARALLDIRNTVVHCMWVEDPEKEGGLKSTRFSARQRFERSQHPQDPAKLLAYADEMNGISDQLEAWRKDWVGSLETDLQAGAGE